MERQRRRRDRRRTRSERSAMQDALEPEPEHPRPGPGYRRRPQRDVVARAGSRLHTRLHTVTVQAKAVLVGALLLQTRTDGRHGVMDNASRHDEDVATTVQSVSIDLPAEP